MDFLVQQMKEQHFLAFDLGAESGGKLGGSGQRRRPDQAEGDPPVFHRTITHWQALLLEHLPFL